MASKSLEKLRQLTVDLCKRDEDRVLELELYNAFFSNIPLRTFVWTVDEKMNIVVKNRKSLASSSCLISNGTLNDAFSCSRMNEYNIKMHARAFEGESQTYISYEGESSFLTTLIPEIFSKTVERVHGCSWDITHLQKMIDVTFEIEPKLRETNVQLADKLTEVYDNAPLIQLILELRKGDA